MSILDEIRRLSEDCFQETLVCAYGPIQCHNPEEQSGHLHCSKNLKTDIARRCFRNPVCLRKTISVRKKLPSVCTSIYTFEVKYTVT
jgi:hypothetical protein